jgi:hypothetical protein
MTLDVFPDPREGVKALLNAAKAARWSTATISTNFPTSDIDVPWIQHAWDGSPSDQANRQVCTIRVTCWAPKGSKAESIALAQLVRAYLLSSGSAAIWRFRRGPGPLIGTDPRTELPFCTFTLTAETRATRVA